MATGRFDVLVTDGSQNQIWQLQGGVVAAVHSLPFWANRPLQGIADVHGDGGMDILYQVGSGALQYVIYLNGFTPAGRGLVTGQTVDEVDPLSGSGGGTDTVNASVSYTLPDHVEHLNLTGTGDIDGAGNALDNTITGNSGANILSGGGGDDLFVFQDGGGNDTIDDFSAGPGAGDVIDISAFGFGAFADVLAAATDIGGDTRIQLDAGDSVTLLGVQAANLDADDFIL